MKRTWQILNIITFAVALVANGLIGAQLIGLPAIDAISDRYATLLTPAGYAFSIWSLIYTLLLVFAIYQARDIIRPRKENDLPLKMGPWFVITNLCNGLWTYIFVNEWVGLSVVILGLLAVSLYILLIRLRIALDEKPLKAMALTWWPLLIYTGWASVALVVNIASWLAFRGVVIGSVPTVLTLVVLMTGLLALLYLRHVRELVLASAWGIAAIGVQQLGQNSMVMVAAFSVAAVLVISTGVHAYWQVGKKKQSLFMLDK